MAALVLGGVEFHGFEIPETVNLGGDHAGKLWKLPGGVRIIDAQGPDDETIEWHGLFRHGTAMNRALLLDGMRRAGSPVLLSVLGLSYQVFIRKFSFHPARGGLEVAYEISLIVLVDNTHGLGFAAVIGITELVAADLAFGSSRLTAPSLAVSAALSTFSAAVAAVPSFETASKAELIPVDSAGVALHALLLTAASTHDALIDPSPAGSILATLDALRMESMYLDAYGYLARASVNISNDLG